MTPARDRSIPSHKVGKEDVVVVDVPASRFEGTVPAHLDPPPADGDSLRLALLAQSLDSYVFEGEEVGATDELHVWLRVAMPEPIPPVEGAEVMLGRMRWMAIASATSNAGARSRLESFGFSPQELRATHLGEGDGSVEFADGSVIGWSIDGPGKGPAAIGVQHVMLMPEDAPDSEGHLVTALVTDTFLEQPGSVHVDTDALEPYLHRGERRPAAIHRMPRLEAEITWRRRAMVRG